MATLIAKAPSIPLIQARRLTCLGMQYTVATPDFLDVVTANGEHLTCTCGEFACIHIQVVQHQRTHDAIISARRNRYTALFDLSYID
jgi:hypothetical protein